MGSSIAENRLNLLCGGVAGASNIFTGFPFDTVKVRLQASPQGTYAGPWDCAKAIWRFEGVRCQDLFNQAVHSCYSACYASFLCLTD